MMGMTTTLQQVLEASELLPALWAEKYDIKTEAGLPFDLDRNHRFMREPFNDLSPLQVWLKPPQVGATTAKILKAAYVAKKLHRDIIYTLPTQSDVYEMVGGKVNRIIAQNEVLKGWVRHHDTVEQKSIGDSLIYFRGTFTAKQAMMVSSSLNIHDEVDASDPGVITQYETRLQARADGWRWYFSHPSLGGKGVDIYWQKSDKKEWYITCESCQHKHVLSWPESIDPVSKAYICPRCKVHLSDEARIMGEWKATATGEFSGYHISQMMCPWITAAKILEAKDDPLKDEQYFYNYVLGLPYVGGSDKIEPEQVLANCVDEVNTQEARVIIGVDTGLPIYYTLLNKDGVFFYGTCDNYDALEKLLHRFSNSILVSDQGGDLIGIRQLQAKYPGRVFLCYYRKDRKAVDLIQWGEGSEFGKVVVDRNRMMSLMVEQMKDKGRLRINGKKEDWKHWANHFGNIYREIVETPERPNRDAAGLYGNEYVWKRTGADHYVHSLLYGLVGLDKYAVYLATFPGGGDAFDGIPKAGMEALGQTQWSTDVLYEEREL